MKGPAKSEMEVGDEEFNVTVVHIKEIKEEDEKPAKPVRKGS